MAVETSKGWTVITRPSGGNNVPSRSMGLPPAELRPCQLRHR